MYLEKTVVTTESGDSKQISSWVEDHRTVTPSDYLVQTEKKKELVEGIKKLNKNEQIVISLFYQEELTLTEIGQILDLTTSRISQIHKRAIIKLKTILRKLNASY